MPWGAHIEKRSRGVEDAAAGGAGPTAAPLHTIDVIMKQNYTEL